LGTVSFAVLKGFDGQSKVRITRILSRYPDGGLEADPVAYDAVLSAAPASYFPLIEEFDDDQTSPALPLNARLLPNFPNPFNASTTLPYHLHQAGPVRLELYDLVGQQIRTLERGFREAGTHSVMWDGENVDGQRVSSGLYLARLHVQDFSQTRKLLLLK
jgi:hypothetical protein